MRRLPLLLLLLLFPSCRTTSELTLEATRPVSMRALPQRVLVVLNGPLLPFEDIEAPGAALLRELASCNLQGDVVARPRDAELSLDGDMTAQAVAQRARTFRPDAILAITPTNQTSSNQGPPTYAYAVEVRDVAAGRPTLRAAARFTPIGRRDVITSDLARLLTAELAKAGAFPCPGRPA